MVNWARRVRLALTVVFVAWIILAGERFISSHIARDPYAQPAGPYVAVGASAVPPQNLRAWAEDVWHAVAAFWQVGSF